MLPHADSCPLPWQKQPLLPQAHLRRLGRKHKQAQVEFPAETYFLKTADSQITASTQSATDSSDFPLRVAPSSDLNPVSP